MKCVNCGSNFKSERLKCPYCGSPNGKGFDWAMDIDKLRKQLDNTKRSIFKSTPLFLWNHICNLLLVLLSVAIVVIIAIGIISEYIKSDKEPFFSEINVSYMEECYQKDDYYSLLNYYNDNGLSKNKDDKYKKYSEYLELYYHYHNFVDEIDRYFNMSQDNLEKYTEYGIVFNMINLCSNYLSKNFDRNYYGKDLAFETENEIIFTKNTEFIYAFLKSEFLLTEEECLYLSNHYVYGDECRELQKKVYLRKGWRFSVDE